MLSLTQKGKIHTTERCDPALNRFNRLSTDSVDFAWFRILDSEDVACDTTACNTCKPSFVGPFQGINRQFLIE